ncbi:thiamine phosphate synthase [Acinetobacter qingfengensis]|uniref:Thiamine-phosphate synthase n=1 Tax=Acinetobacter qingfengensis TaxID=1262585 RepID=A0A1E7R760_9GAMM|nr:thiamine phosphate synthase [Acinetobacter qingfengensis]KAA8734418.1 thiamine phosphate synthase [Acinetobacter qingfengensis]OEY95141.1 thiamine-phosphate diphosphorylase [Acinetobacter qingfengensis]
MRGLYLITNDDPLDLLLQKLQAAMSTRQIALLQYRRKKVEKIEQTVEIGSILALTERYDVPLIINDDLDQAKQFSVHVHLGQDDGSIQKARALLGSEAIIGRTCLNSLELAEQAIAEGASYVAFGAIYGSTTKPEAKNIGLSVIQQARQHIDVPICTIGGLTAENSEPVIAAGADLCAVVSDILALDVAHIPERVDAWAKLF